MPPATGRCWLLPSRCRSTAPCPRGSLPLSALSLACFLAGGAGVKKVVLKHFVMEDESASASLGEAVREAFAGEVIVGEDGMEIPLQ